MQGFLEKDFESGFVGKYTTQVLVCCEISKVQIFSGFKNAKYRVLHARTSTQSISRRQRRRASSASSPGPVQRQQQPRLLESRLWRRGPVLGLGRGESWLGAAIAPSPCSTTAATYGSSQGKPPAALIFRLGLRFGDFTVARVRVS